MSSETFMTPKPSGPKSSPPKLCRHKAILTSESNMIKPINLFPKHDDPVDTTMSPPEICRMIWNPNAFTTPNQVFNREGPLDAPLKNVEQLEFSESELNSVKSAINFD